MFEVNHKEHINIINIFKVNIENTRLMWWTGSKLWKKPDYCGEQIGS